MYYFLRTTLWALILVIRTLKDKEIQANSVLKLSLSQVVGNIVHWAPLQYFLNLSCMEPVWILNPGLWEKLFFRLLPPSIQIYPWQTFQRTYSSFQLVRNGYWFLYFLPLLFYVIYKSYFLHQAPLKVLYFRFFP